MIFRKGHLKILLTFVLILFLIACNSDSPNNDPNSINPPSHLLKGKEISVSDFMYRPIKILLTDNKLIVYDNVDDNIFKIFSYPEIKHLDTWGKKGEGPNNIKFINSNSLSTIDNNLFYVEHTTLKSINFSGSLPKMNTSNIFLDSKQGPLNGFSIISDSLFLADVNDMLYSDKEHRLLLPNEETLNYFGTYPNEDIPFEDPTQKIFYYQKSTIANSTKGRIISFYMKLPKIKIYNLKGKLLKELDYGKTVNQFKEGRTNHIYYVEPFSTDKFLYILYVNREKSQILSESGNYKPEIHQYTWDGILVNRFILDKPLISFTLSKKHKKIYGIFINKSNTIFEFDVANYDL